MYTIVGDNPNLLFVDAAVRLTGTKTEGYFGTSYDTGMIILDILEMFL